MLKREKYDLSSSNTFGLKVSCACHIEYDSVEELASLDVSALPGPLLSVGEGSNLLFTGDFPGTVLRSRISYIKYFDVGADQVPVAVGAGVKWDDFVAKACDDALWGAENLSGIPGTVGAAAVQNIGAYGVEAKDIIAGVTLWDLQKKEKVSFKAAECKYGYRDSIFKSPEFKGRYVVTGVLFRLSRKAVPRTGYKGLSGIDTSSPKSIREAVLGIRCEKLPDPAKTGSAGSYFKNPIVSAGDFARISEGFETVPHYVLDGGFIKVPAAWMIEQCSLKGYCVGGAAVYDKQPLVIVNASGNATSQDILELEKTIIDKVEERFGVTLHPEVEHI